MVGNEDDARVALEIVVRALGPDLRSDGSFLKEKDLDLPEGWEYLDQGSYRIAFLSPGSVVYKVEYWEWDDDPHLCNYVEAAAVRVGMRIPEFKGYLPQTSLFEVDGSAVVAMEFIPEECEHAEESVMRDIMRLEDRLCSFVDSYQNHNLRQRKQGDVILVDLGSDGSTETMDKIKELEARLLHV